MANEIHRSKTETGKQECAVELDAARLLQKAARQLANRAKGKGPTHSLTNIVAAIHAALARLS